ncbi:MAG: metalloprotease family protein [Spirochaetia bacterium]|nr:metalloprotease family protein [Spirochaetia bacterium]
MFFIPGILVSVATFPGVIVHEVAHQLFCRWRRIPVFDVKYFQFELGAQGYVIHAEPKDFLSSFLISFGPLFLNTLLCFLISLPALIPQTIFSESPPASMFLIWLSVSIGMHAFPSTQDAQNVWKKAREEIKNPLALLSFPIVIVIYVANMLRFFWFDAIYGLAVGFLIPGWILNHLPF